MLNSLINCNELNDTDSFLLLIRYVVQFRTLFNAFQSNKTKKTMRVSICLYQCFMFLCSTYSITKFFFPSSFINID